MEPAPHPPTAAACHPGLEELYRAHAPMILRTAWRITRDGTEAEDILHGLFASLLRRGEWPTPVERAGPYLHRAAINRALDLLRRKRRLTVLTPDAGGPVDWPDPAPPVGSDLELADCLRTALARLNPADAELFTLRHVEGLSNREIGRLTGRSWGAVAVALHRIRRRLQSLLPPGGPRS